MRFLDCLSSRETRFGTPWDFSPYAIPDPVRGNKKLRDAWINDPATRHCVYSTWEGLSENLRVSHPKGEEEGNAPHKCYGFVADFDTKMSLDEVALGFPRMSVAPTYYGVSLSGKAHLVWVFENPITISGFDLAKEFLTLILEKVKLTNALPGLDVKAFTDCGKYYTSGGDWYCISEEKIPVAVATGWLIEAGKKIDWKRAAFSIPLSVVRDELLKNPKFAQQWGDIDFQLEAMGPTWWIDASVSPKSAIVKETGMFTWSSSAGKNFYAWGDLIGWSFVDMYRANNVGEAVDGIYFDGRGFWREITRGDWKNFSREDILHNLRVKRGLSPKIEKGENASELDHAYEHLIDHNHIEGAAPFIFRPNGVLQIEGRPYLNTSTRKVLTPADEVPVWGPTGPMPFLSQFFGPPSLVNPDEEAKRLFQGGTEALDIFFSELAHFYRTAHAMSLSSGRNFFLIGPQNIGKTFLNRSIVGALLNGYKEAKEYLMGEDNFGAELFAVAHWVVDDGTMSTSAAAHRRWSEILKRMAANKTFRYHEKFRSPQQVEWQGRVGVTGNDDEESARIFPDLEISIKDKVNLFRTSLTPTVDFPPQAETAAILEKELPHFARFLLAWETPEYCVLRRPNGSVDYRFGGCRPWHDLKLVSNANQSSRTAGFMEILTDWMEEHFTTINEDKRKDERITSWRGSAFQLRKVMCCNPGTADALRGVDNGDIGRLLSALKSKGYPLETDEVDGIRYWTIKERQKP